MIEVFNLSFNLTACHEPILTVGLECSQNFQVYEGVKLAGYRVKRGFFLPLGLELHLPCHS